MWVTLQGPLPRVGEKRRTQEPWAELPKPSPKVMLQRGGGIALVREGMEKGLLWDLAAGGTLSAILC